MSGPAVLQLHPDDNVVVCCRAVAEGETIGVEDTSFVANCEVAIGHKIAVRPIDSGERVLKYGVPIGSATMSINRGDWVHMHNMKSDYIAAHGRDDVGDNA